MIETAAAFAKINLSLDIISKMDDGYHSIKTVMQSIDLSDEITVECTPGEGVSVETGLQYLPDDERNIAAKAALAFFRHAGIAGYSTHIKINKIIPVCAGLGGGSTDGACVLRMLDKMFNTGMGLEILEKIGGGIGSDIPFCLSGGTKLAEGRGEILTELKSIPHCYFVICKPPFSCSTPELFGRVRCEKIKARPDTDGIVEALKNSDLKGVARRMYNVFEDVLPRGTYDIASIKYALHDNGALGAAMTGSGPAVFGLFDDVVCAQNAFCQLKPTYRECFLAETTEESTRRLPRGAAASR